MKKLIFLLLALTLTVFSCRKDFEETTITEEHYNPPVIKVNGSLLGRVIDENANPVSGATVHLGSNTVTTGEFGFFRFDDKVLNAAGTFVSVEMPGYFQGSDRFFPQANKLNYTTIQLLPKTVVGTVSGADGGEVSLSSGAIVRLPAGGVVDANGQTYTGDVQVSAQWLNPKADRLGDFMPGNLQGISESGEEMSMATYGMLAVELTSTNGEPLNMGNDQKATLEFPIVSELSASAPQEIPLWYFDEVAGLWMEEGKAVRNGDTYVGEVAHFSFWNCDDPFTLVNLTGMLVDSDGNAWANVVVEITVTSNASVGWGYTNVDGVFGGAVPMDEAMVLVVRDNCNGIALSQDIGPFSEDVDLGAIVVELSAATAVNLTGTLIDCDGNPVTNGVVEMTWGNNWNFFLNVEADGTFSMNTSLCDDQDFSLVGIDLGNQFQSEEITGTAPADQDLGTISACAEELDEYVRIVYEGNEYEYLLPMSYSDTSLTAVDAWSQDSTYAVSFTFAGDEVGTFPLGLDNRFFYFDTENFPTDNFSCAGSCDVEFTITQYGAVGEKIMGSFEGTVDKYDFTQSMYTPVPISGTFKVDRDQ